MNYKILNTIGPQFSTPGKEILATLGQVDYLLPGQEELKEIIDQYQILIVGLGLKIDQAIIERAANLQLVATITTGLDHLDSAALEQRGIKVISLKAETEFLKTISGTAELAFGLLLDLARNISQGFASVKNNSWARDNFIGHSLAGKILGLVGLGRLGKIMAGFGQGFKMRVIAHDPYLGAEEFEKNNCQRVSFEDLLKESDVISLHCHLNAETKNLFNFSIFKQMKPGAILINTARGQIVNEVDLLWALENKIMAGYATDVLANEADFGRVGVKNPLIDYAQTHSNLIITPHLGGLTFEGREATDIFIAEKVKEWSIKK